MVATLPPDVLLLLCEELGNRQDFGTLFNCALSSKGLAGAATLWLYRVHNQSEFFRNDEVESEVPSNQRQSFEDRFALQRRYTLKWALLWKSIILSSLGQTAYPYSLYIRTLDLRNLAPLLEDPRFRESAFETFFSDGMSQFLKASDTPVKKETRKTRASHIRLNTAQILDLVGESITKFVSDAADRNGSTVGLEDVAGDISSIALPRWVGRLTRLKSMTLWDGAVLNGSIATAISNHCPEFNDLTFCFCLRNDVDPELASFFSGLRPHSLQSFTAISANGIGPETLLALNSHSQSIKGLKLHGLRSDAIKNISLLQGCDALEVLEIHDADGFINLEATENDIFLEVIAWLGRCDQLRELSFKKFLSAPAVLTEVCLRNNIRLRQLQVIGYVLTSNQAFHQALSHQTSLGSLKLQADPEGSFRDDIDTLISSICQLRDLKELDLIDTSDYFKSAEIRQLASSLTKLEKLSFGGLEVTDDVWPSIAGLTHLRAFTSHAFTSFTLDGLLNFISTLRPTNQGLVLSVMSQNGDYDLTDTEKTIVQDSIVAKVSGKFEFELYREAEDSDSGSD